jgi:Cdc6-like AAA superfamily ATPase
LNCSKRTCFCPGKPGSGKTVLTSIVIQHIQKISDSDPSIGVAWIYGDYKQRKAQTLESLLGSLLAQLIRGRTARRQPEAWKVVEDLNRKYHQNVTASAKDLSSMLLQEAHHFRTVYIIIDALDECGRDELIRDDLLEVVQALPPNTQLFLTSRDIPNVEENIEDPLRIEIWARQEDVENYVIGRINGDRHLKTHCTADARLQDQITRALTGNSGGM